MFIKVITISCLVAAVSCASAPRRPNVFPSASQVVPQAVAAPGSAAEQAAKLAAQQAKLHYVEIGPSLKGDYKFGYDTGSGPAGQSFREETRLDDGTVKGAYGYVDANGKQRIVKYTAGKNGFVVEGDQEAPGQGGSQQAAAAAAPAQQQAPEARRPQPVALPQAVQPNFDEQQQPAAFATRAQPQAGPSAEDRARAEQQHAEQLRQHQLAQQAALAQQQRLAQQLELQQQQIAAQQAAARQQQQQQRQVAQPQQLPQQFPQQPPTHQVVDPQNGQFFSSSSDSNLNQLLQNQLRQLQSGNQFAGQFQPPQQALPQQQQQQQQGPQHFAAQAAPAFQPTGQQPAAFDFSNQQQFRGARQVQQQPQSQQAAGLPQSALIALHQQQQHDAQVLANLRAQQLQQHQRLQQQQQQQQAAPSIQQFQPSEAVQTAPIQRVPQQQQQPQQFAPQPQFTSSPSNGSPVAANQPTPQPEVFGPPVIDIRTLNYSIGQQTRVN